MGKSPAKWIKLVLFGKKKSSRSCSTKANDLSILTLIMEAILERPNYECLLFDLDDTFYPLSAGINLSCRKNIQDCFLGALYEHGCHFDTRKPSVFEFMKGNATNMALLRGWRLAVNAVVLDLEKRKHIL
ncbi:unnamed protein product [Miscanthus lutarioriparius]|uniref:Uncharacterized protein n=1 Tax=Miscanthus lutarioriparius TaxID=422564 RepID=A0A811P184_9POAL|nr:unnamed protein product [Miscanthus lutarioriparius]